MVGRPSPGLLWSKDLLQNFFVRKNFSRSSMTIRLSPGLLWTEAILLEVFLARIPSPGLLWKDDPV